MTLLKIANAFSHRFIFLKTNIVYTYQKIYYPNGPFLHTIHCEKVLPACQYQLAYDRKNSQGGYCMSKLALKVDNYERILSFMDDINVQDPEFRKEVLKAFEDLFGIERMNFWLCDESYNIFDPITNNISKDVTEDYVQNYLVVDPLLPKKVRHFLPKHRVLVLTLDLPKKAYENNEYFTDFMRRKNGLYDCTTLFLFKDERVLGLLDFSLRDKRKLSRSETMCLEIITRFLTERFHEHLALQQKHSFYDVTLTPREKEVLRYVKQGLSNKQIAKQLYISVNTVKKHVQHLYDKFEVNNRTSLTNKVNHLENELMKIS